MEYIRLEQDADGIVEMILDQPGKAVNTMGAEYAEAMADTVATLEAMVADGDIKGVYVRSGKDTFVGGGDLSSMLDAPKQMSEAEATEKFDGILDAKRSLRRLETLGVPVAVGINGAALGGGYEICLACHHRVILDAPGVQVGLPEAQLGLMPGAGGVVRMVRMFGCQSAIDWISAGRKFKARQGFEKGWVDETADSLEDMHTKAKAWLLANPEARQPWDREGFRIPGGAPGDSAIPKALQGLFHFGPGNVINTTKDNLPAPKAIFACVHDVARVDFDTAEKIEARYFLKLLDSQVSRNMMRTFFFQLNDINKGLSRPADIETTRVAKLGILGAGQMGAGLAFTAANAGIDVVLKDISADNAERGKDWCRKACEKNRRIDQQQAEQLLQRITPTGDYRDLSDCELVIEAVFEDRNIKAQVTQETEVVVKENCVFASNTSALPITELAQASSNPENFIGMHFFSPVEKMPLVEIICGELTSAQTLAKAFDLARQLGKTPIVVNDAPGFFTTRVIGTTISEGATMVMEGVHPALIENAARFNGSPVGPLSAIDEISQETAYKNGEQAKADAEARGETPEQKPAALLVERMVKEFGRRGKVHGGGYYEYPQEGAKYLWPGLKDHFAPEGYCELPFEDVKDRLLFCQCIEAVRAMEEGVVNSAADGNVGSIFGIGFPAHTGGVFQFINAYGVREFVSRAAELTEKYGSRFAPPQLLLDKAEKNQLFV
ncbi:3-hydroxyacyl-CoA dehydrogenase [Pseudomaricurvus alkylphenolicus]|jgi:3-hydroxyacyl-CoA dehydrogenase/enoyl-CoA hydratase/3-hydroxybutyryl-CoA epimerase|uniref:3-hydroxyacyl-CoA dehydrogenase NAD-binding domain-containing protein n=1 Tax=Pseudomaricurvus alkylphenolicus TaxID=1306991 RepID=UPI0014244AC0|nr:3-hydroxyacyl-CoA dehydrogenase NAD-binding domain-containing protein [Pseudomaricurvus alkylphenolicus]NIB38064.1 3-hydroxyacyl-CoA dehydrogenase [Pseudomaricurvus alkylphenolicus]